MLNDDDDLTLHLFFLISITKIQFMRFKKKKSTNRFFETYKKNQSLWGVLEPRIPKTSYKDTETDS